MDDAATRALREVLELLKARRGEEASALLADILLHDPNNEQAWHMLSYAVADRDRQVLALQRVLRINPRNRHARKRLADLSDEVVASSPSLSVSEPVAAPAPPAAEPTPARRPVSEPADIPPPSFERIPAPPPALEPAPVEHPQVSESVDTPPPAAEPASIQSPPDVGPSPAVPHSLEIAGGSDVQRIWLGPAVPEGELIPVSLKAVGGPSYRSGAGQSGSAAVATIPRTGVGPSGSAAVATIPRTGGVAFPRTVAKPEIRYSRWQRLRIRMGLTWRRFKMDWRIFAQSRLAILGVLIIITFGIMAIAHPILIRTVWPRAIYDPTTGFDTMVFLHPSPPAWVEEGSQAHLLGTDTLGRDVLSMLLAATTPTFVIGLTAALATAFVGTVMSVTAAYFRGPVDAVITNLADVFLLFPAPVVMVIIGARFRDLGPVPLGLIYGFVTGAGPTALVMRSHALQAVSKPYMDAAQIAGGGASHIITKHLLPAMMPLAALQMMIAVTGAVVADGFISFFGLTRSVSNWGTLIYDAFVYQQVGGAGASMWHMLLPAALSFSLFAMGFYLVSRGLHRVASPTIREEQAVA